MIEPKLNSVALIMAGGTGGHIFPGIAVANELRKNGWTVSWLGSAGGMEENLVKNADIELDVIEVSGVRGKGVIGWLKLPFSLTKAVIQARKIVKARRPNVVLGFGGFVAGPGGIATKLTGLPLIIHEQNAIAGLTNRVLSKMAVKVFQAFPGAFAPSEKVVTVGNPVRESICELNRVEQTINLDGTINILVIGGSRGALALNRHLPEQLLDVIKSKQVSVVHQAGKGRVNETKKFYADAGIEKDSDIEVVEFIDDMASHFKQANLVICRAGASTVSEIAAAGKAAIFVPFPYAVDDHQTANAKWLSENGAAIIVQESEFVAEKLKKEIQKLIESPQQINSMANKAKKLALLDASKKVAVYCDNIRKQAA